MRNKLCYYCGCPATSDEHVPPICLFPAQKDAFGVDHRKNLFTVPSCDEHNIRKSKDDEFLMMCLTSVVGNNALGYLQTQTKLHRAVKRTDGRLLGTAIRDPENATIVTRDGTEFPALIGKADMPRLCNALEHIARGLYFLHTGERFIGKIIVLPAFIKYVGDKDVEIIKQFSGVMINQEIGDWEQRGENQAVFYYRMGPIDQHGLMPMLMTFFGSSDVYVAFLPEGVKLPHRTLNEATFDNSIVIDLTILDAK